MTKEFDIDVSGTDIFSRDYSIVIADNNDLVRGYKFDQSTIQVLRARQGEGKYRYGSSKQDKSLFRVRIYCIIIYYLFKDLDIKDKNQEILLNICKDFQGHEKDINSYLTHLLKNKLGLNIKIRYFKLGKESNADKYAYLMRKDKKNLIKGYVNINLKDIEILLK